MKIGYSKQFHKQYKKLDKAIKKKFAARLEMFMLDQNNPLLGNHKLHGKYVGYKSINITADIRAIYKKVDANTFDFVEIGTHSQLYY